MAQHFDITDVFAGKLSITLLNATTLLLTSLNWIAISDGIEHFLKIILLMVTIIYTIYKLLDIKNKPKSQNNEREVN